MTYKLFAIASAVLLCAASGWVAADKWFAREWHGDAVDAAKYNRKRHQGSSQADSLDGSPAHLPVLQFEDASTRMGLDFVYDDGANGDFHLMETIGGGMAIADFNRDGSLDLFFPNGCRLPVDSRPDAPRSELFRQIAGGERAESRRFFHAAEVAGVSMREYAQGASAADFNQDGFEDLLVTGFHFLRLYRNQGDGTFVPHSLPSPDQTAFPHRWWTSAAWFDADSDGDLDAYVCAYATVDAAHPRECRRGELRMHCHPSVFPAEPDLFVENLSDGRFADASLQFGFSEKDGRGLGVAVADLTGSGMPSVYVANDTTEAVLWVRDAAKAKRYANQAGALGVGLTASGSAMAGMGVAVGDYDRNGHPDLFVTDFYEAGASLFASFGDVGFIPKSTALGLLAPTRRRLGFGTAFLDADLDGWPDLVAVNGHVSDLTTIGIPYKMKAQAFRNEQGRRYNDVSNAAGEFFRKPLLGRGLATGDFDEDGGPDFVVSNIRDQAALLLNRTNPRGEWIGFDFVGRRSARGARNVKVALRRGKNIERLEQHSGGGFLSSSDPRLIVGLGPEKTPIDEVEVIWPSRVKQLLSKPIANRYHLVVEPMEPTP